MKKILLLLAILSANSYALVVPATLNDTHIRYSYYRPDNVTLIQAGVGITTTIQLEKGETIPKNGASIGNSDAWQVSENQNFIVMKPTSKANPNTNLTLTSNKGRIYSFYLKLTKHPFYVVKMRYTQPHNDQISRKILPCSKGAINFNWKAKGNQDLRPDYMWSDGTFTCLSYKHTQVLPIPYVYRDGVESLANMNMIGDVMVIHTTSKEFRMRYGKEVLALTTTGKVSSGYNHSGASDRYKKRVLKNDEMDNYHAPKPFHSHTRKYSK